MSLRFEKTPDKIIVYLTDSRILDEAKIQEIGAQLMALIGQIRLSQVTIARTPNHLTTEANLFTLAEQLGTVKNVDRQFFELQPSYGGRFRDWLPMRHCRDQSEFPARPTAAAAWTEMAPRFFCASG